MSNDEIICRFVNDDEAINTEILQAPSIQANIDNVVTATTIINDHRELEHRDANDQHPISAITNLQSSLDAKANQATTYTKTEVDTALNLKADKSTTYTKTETDTLLSAKQDTLTAGDNITISGNTISATDTTYTAGTGIDITNNVISNTQTSAEWGNITGTLSTQTDLQTALDGKQNTISDLSTIRSGASLGATSIQPNDNITELTNNAGYITKSVNDLTNYTKTSDLGDLALKDTVNYETEVTNKPTIPTVGNGTITLTQNGTTKGSFTTNQSGDTSIALDGGNVDDVKVNGSSVVTNKVANISVPTVNNSTITIQKNNIDIDSFTLNQNSNKSINIEVPIVVNDVISTDTNKSLSANMGKELNDRINSISARGRYLSSWNCTTGLAGTTPTTLPYTYKTGDYFIISVVGTTNYKPNGTTYTGVASTTVETNTVKVNDTYLFDGSVWTLLHGADITVTFASIEGQPSDNSNLASALNSKVDKEEGKGLSSNDFTTAEKTKLANVVTHIEDGTGTNSLQQTGATALGTNSVYIGKIESYNVTIDEITISEGIPTIKVIYPEGNYQVKKNSILKITDENQRTALYYVTNRPDKGATTEDKRTLVLDSDTRTVSKGVDSSYTHTITTTLTGTISVYNGIVALEDSRVLGNFTNILDFAYPSIEGQTDSSNSISTGSRNIITGSNCTAIGEYCILEGDLAFAQGRFGKAIGNQSTVEGSSCSALNSNAHAEGLNTIAYGQASHSEGNANKSKGENSHTEGQNNLIETNGTNAHAEGYNNTVKSANSHAEGQNNEIQNDSVFCHAEGNTNLIKYSSQGCHIEGNNNTIEYANQYIHMGGHDNIVEPHEVSADFVHGGYLKARNPNGYQLLFGKFNDIGTKVVKRFTISNDTVNGRLVVRIGNFSSSSGPSSTTVVYNPQLINLTTGTTVTELMTTTQTSKEVKKWRRTGSCQAASNPSEGCYGIKGFNTSWSIIDYIDDLVLSAGTYEFSFYVRYGSLPFNNNFSIFVSHEDTELTDDFYSYTNYDENGAFEIGNGTGTYNRKNLIRINDKGKVIAGNPEVADTDDLATLTTKYYVDQNKANNPTINIVQNNIIKGSFTLNQSNNQGIYIVDTGATFITTSGDGNAVTSASYNDNNRTITLTKGSTFVQDDNYVHTDNNFTDTYKANIETNNAKVSNVQSDWNSSSGLSQILNKPTLATVATTGSYNDLSNKPTIPTKISDLTDDTATNPIDKADTLTGLTATVSELNVLDGITASTTELNYTDGVTSNIQTQLNSKQATLTAGTGINISSNTVSTNNIVWRQW